jgi:DNA-binding XRE family transcriptional regulator
MKSWDFKSTGFDGVPAAPSSTEGQVIIAHFPRGDFDVPPPNTMAIDDYIASLEADEETRGVIAEGRKWLAETYYGDEPESLRHLRLARGLSQSRFADLVGTSQSHIARLEAGITEPQVSTVEKLAIALNIAPGALFEIFRKQISANEKTA